MSDSDDHTIPTPPSSHLTRSILLWIGMILIAAVGETLIDYGTTLFTRRIGSFIMATTFYAIGARIAMWIKRDRSQSDRGTS